MAASKNRSVSSSESPEFAAAKLAAKAHFDCAGALEQSGKLDEAVAELRRAAKLDPQAGEAQINLAALLEKLGHVDESLAAARRAVELRPDHPIAHYNLARVLQTIGRLGEADAEYSRAIELDREFALAFTNRGCCRLLQGNYAAGWSDYEWRLRTALVQTDRYPQPRWNGRPLPTGTLLIHGEQGIGDEIQFASCIPDLVPLADQCVLVCHPRLARFMARSFPAVVVVGHDRQANGVPPQLPLPIDAQIASGSVPMYLRRTLDGFPTRKRYLLADPQQIRGWRQRYDAIGAGVKIGISWFGGGTWEERRRRTTELKDWHDVLTVAGVDFVNLQYGSCTGELNAVAKSCGKTIHHFEEADPLGDIDNFAAKVAALDLVIAVGNATVHLAGALGVPTWCLAPAAPQWRWAAAGDKTPWYPSVWIIRQLESDRWKPTLTKAARELENVVRHSGRMLGITKLRPKRTAKLPSDTP
ncbi:MAG TPA: tetratricopeptide repeat-containing glycosyltransferase family protein, partial [Pirellulales bacterium]